MGELTHFHGSTPHGFAVDQPTVLVVDDDPPVRRAVERVLRINGVTVYSADGPTTARALLGEIHVHAVISDLKMPDGDGISFLSWVRATHPQVQRILLSGHYEMTDVEHAINLAGVHRFLSKPYATATLVETVRQSIDQWAIAAERDRLLDVTTQQKEALLSLTADLEVKVAHRTALLERATRTWTSTFDSIDDPMALVDKQFRLRRGNLAVADAAGENIRSLIGRKCHEVLFARDSVCEGCPLTRDGVLDSPRQVEMTDERDGRTWEVSAWPLTEEGQAADGEAWAVCHYKDVSAARALQRQVIMLEKLAAIGELAGCVAHELNNPLTGILIFSQVMSRGVAADEVVGLAEDIEEAARRCTRIVQSLLDFARGGSQDPGELTTVDVVDLIGDCVNLAHFHLTGEDSVTVEWDPPVGLTHVYGNTDALKSLFLNLINNAIQAMDKRGTVSIRATECVDERMIRVVVVDTGPGIPDELVERIFQPFFTTKAKNKGGTGLGLAIVSNVVRDHGGRVSVENSTEGGARFIVELPVVIG